MKNEFEKWFEGYMEKHKDKWTRLMIKQLKELYRFTWEAALKWTLKRHAELTTEHEDSLYAGILVFLEIKEELESLSQQGNDQS